ncbi:MAG: hypothetical protein LQ339_008978 [Xanthoria mediterranea]|nr:MAG: hypothetical protein LQ339_008978 [Xanthoria mediterranea]
MAEAFAVAASVITLFNTSRKAVEGIAKLAELRHAPEILLALNNEVVDLQYLLEDLTDLEHKFHDTLQEAFTPSLRRTIDRTTAVLLALDELIAYKLTKPGSRAGILRVDRSTWLRSQDRIGRILEDVRDCRIRLANAMAIVTASLTVRSYNVSRRLGIQMEAFMADNDECHQEIAHRLVGVRNQPVRSVTPATPEAERSDSNTEREDVFVSNTSSSTTTEHDAIMPNVLYIRDGRVDDLKRLIDCKQASLQDVDNTFGLTALHWALEYGWVDLASFLVRAGADLAAEDGFGLTPRHCLLFGYTWLNFHIPSGDEEMFLRRHSKNFDILSDSELLEEPALCKTYHGKDTHITVRANLNSLGGINDVDALGGTLLMKAVRRADEPTGEGMSVGRTE